MPASLFQIVRLRCRKLQPARRQIHSEEGVAKGENEKHVSCTTKTNSLKKCGRPRLPADGSWVDVQRAGGKERRKKVKGTGSKIGERRKMDEGLSIERLMADTLGCTPQ
jgi:hypothetical protein